MNRYILSFILVSLSFINVLSQTSPFSMRLDYMLKQIDDEHTQPSIRISWADSVIKNKSAVGNMDILSDVLTKKAKIAYNAAFYRKSLNAYLEWIRDFGPTAENSTRMKIFDRTAELYYYMGWYELSIRLSFDIIKSQKADSLRYLDVLSYQRMAHSYIRMHDMHNAQRYTNLAESCFQQTNINDIGIKNKTAFDMRLLKAGISIINSDFQETYRHLAEAKKFAKGVRDSIAILGDEAILYEAIGDIDISRKCYESIINLKDSSYQSMVCINNYIYFLIGQKEYAKAHQICTLSYSLLDAMELDHSKSNLLDLESDIYSYENDFRNAYDALRKSKEINDTIFTPEQLSYIYGLNNLTDHHTLSKALAVESKKNRILNISGLILLGISLMSIIMWVTNAVRIKKLRIANFADSLILKSAINDKDSLIAELNSQITIKNREIETYAEAIGDEESANARFNNMQCKLIPHLTDRHPDLTKAELNMAVYILLGVSSKDIANRQNLSVRTIENTKYRLYKKLGVPTSDVPEYLRSFIS